MPTYKRVLLKLSGEALAGTAGFGIDAGRIREVCGEIAEVLDTGVEMGVVVGGGNFFRGVRASETGLQRISVDQMGMLATAMNGIALRDFLEAAGRGAELMNAVDMGPFAPRFDRRAALAALAAGRVVIFAGGTGNPLFSTDTAAALRAVEVGADVLLKATKVDGVYDKDPVQHSGARFFEEISYSDVLSGGLAVMDAAAVSVCRENNLPVVVFNLNVRGNIRRVVEGGKAGTLVH